MHLSQSVVCDKVKVGWYTEDSQDSYLVKDQVIIMERTAQISKEK
jgi:hypothetical protein